MAYFRLAGVTFEYVNMFVGIIRSLSREAGSSPRKGVADRGRGSRTGITKLYFTMTHIKPVGGCSCKMGSNSSLKTNHCDEATEPVSVGQVPISSQDIQKILTDLIKSFVFRPQSWFHTFLVLMDS